jgi:hypothetical protein
VKALLLLIFTVAIVASARAQTGTQTAQTEAIRLYPELATPGSPFNQRFLKAIADAKSTNDPILSQPDWPLVLAKRVAAAGGQKQAWTTVANPGRGLSKLVKLTVEQVAGSPFSLEGALIELTDISKIDVQEIEAGVYELTIWGANYNALTATLPRQHATAAERSRTLLISVDKPARIGTTVIVHGNKANYRGLSTMPSPSWQ